MTLCGPCRSEWLAWLDYREPRQVKLVDHAAYDSTPAGVRDNLRALWGHWRDTILFEQAHIARLCAEQHARPVDQLAVVGGVL